MPDDSTPRRSRWVVAVLVILPLWLFVSAGLGLWKYFHDSKKEESVEPVKFTTPISEERLADDLRKLVELVGRRNSLTEAGRRGLSRASSMIQGSLGAGNAGYRLEVEGGPGGWPIILATLPGGSAQPLWVVVGYDTLGSGVEANSTGLASVLAVAHAMAGEEPRRPIKFAFLPHVHEANGPIGPMLDQFVEMLGKPNLVLVVEAMGAGQGLMVSSRDVEVLSKEPLTRLTTVVDLEEVLKKGDIDLAAALCELKQPGVRVATRRVVTAAEMDDRMPDPADHAESTHRLAELVMSLAN